MADGSEDFDRALSRPSATGPRRQPGGGFLRSMGVVALGNLAGKASLFLVAPILSRIFGPEDYGVSGVVVAIAGAGAAVSSLCYDRVIVSALNNRSRANAVALVSLLIAAASGLLAVGLGGVLLGTGLGRDAPAADFPMALLLLAPLLMAAQGFDKSVVGNLLVVSRSFRRIAAVDAMRGVVTSATQILLGLVGVGALGLVVGRIVGHVAALAGMTVGDGRTTRLGEMRRHMDRRGLRRIARSYYRQAVLQTPAAALNLLATSMPLFLFTPYFGVAAAGAFYFINALAMNALMFFNNNAPNLVLREVAQRRQSGKPAAPFLLRLTLALAVPAFLAAGVMTVYGVELITIVFGEQWRLAGEVFRYTAFYYAAVMVVFPTASVISLFRSQHVSLLVQFARVLVTVASIAYGASQGDFMLSVMLLVGSTLACQAFGVATVLVIVSRDDSLRRRARA